MVMPTTDEITILIAARNAATTIGRAINSVTVQGTNPIIVIDDFSTDGTASVAKNYGGKQLTVIRPPRHESLGLTRQSGLEAVSTRYTILLDADDALLPGRIRRMQEALDRTGFEIFADALVLNDGITGKFIRNIPIPEFLTTSPIPARLFERNYLPGVGQLGFATALAQQVGYDPTLHGSEDIDLALRMMLAGGRFYFERQVGYQMYAYPGSVSRDIDNTRSMYRKSLKKFSYQSIQSFLLEHTTDERITLWGLVSMAMFREEYKQALLFLSQLEKTLPATPEMVLEPDGPQPYPENWRLAFHQGTALLLLGDDLEATIKLERARSFRVSPETLNNLAVAYSRRALFDNCDQLLDQALALFPGYLDANLNRVCAHPRRITTHPLRIQANRSEYHIHGSV